MILAVSKVTELDCDCIPRIAAGLQGGLGAGEACGAVTAGVLAIGLLYGQDQSDMVDPRTKEFMQKFSERAGAVRCIDRVGFDISSAASGEDFGKIMELLWFFARGGKKVCNKAVSSAVRVVLEQWEES